jgi:hypothetical protein
VCIVSRRTTALAQLSVASWSVPVSRLGSMPRRCSRYGNTTGSIWPKQRASPGLRRDPSCTEIATRDSLVKMVNTKACSSCWLNGHSLSASTARLMLTAIVP